MKKIEKVIFYKLLNAIGQFTFFNNRQIVLENEKSTKQYLFDAGLISKDAYNEEDLELEIDMVDLYNHMLEVLGDECE